MIVRPMVYSGIFTDAELADRLVLNRTSESLVLEFKREIHIPNKGDARDGRGQGKVDWKQRKRELATEVALDIAQFANTVGGTLLFGVAEADRSGVAESVPGIRNASRLRRFISDVVLPKLYPQPRVLLKDLDWNGRLVLSANVAPSVGTLVAVKPGEEKSGLIFVGRDEQGKRYLSPDEVAMNMSGTTRRWFLRGLEVRTAAIGRQPGVSHPLVRLSSGVRYPGRGKKELEGELANRYGAGSAHAIAGFLIPPESKQGLVHGEDSHRLIAVSEHALSMEICRPGGVAKSEIEVPLDFVKAIWLTRDGLVGLALSVTIVIPGPGGGVIWLLDE